jgi:hypothetical protein
MREVILEGGGLKDSKTAQALVCPVQSNSGVTVYCIQECAWFGDKIVEKGEYGGGFLNYFCGDKLMGTFTFGVHDEERAKSESETKS